MLDFPEELTTIEMKVDEPLSTYTYTRTGGPADYLMFPTNKEEMIDIIAYCKSAKVPWMVLGNGSNLIIREGGIRGVVIMTEKMITITEENTIVTAECGAILKDVANASAQKGLTGFEFASGIPGSIGGAVYMNAGAYGGEMKDVILDVEVVDESGKLNTLPLAECEFTYRHSIFQTIKTVIISTRLQLKVDKEDSVNSEIQRLTDLRESKQPLEYPSCGSVFKRPEGHYTGALIQEAGLQGYQIGGAQVSKKHAGFIVNRGGATATDYIELIQYIQNEVNKKFGIMLEPEVNIIGEQK